jgi:hypothetical protein
MFHRGEGMEKVRRQKRVEADEHGDVLPSRKRAIRGHRAAIAIARVAASP